MDEGGEPGEFKEANADELQPRVQHRPPPPLPPLQLALWLTVAALLPLMVALLGVLARYLQVTTTPPFPPLRFTATLNLLALPTLLLFYTVPRLALRARRSRQLDLQRSAACEPTLASQHGSSSGGSSSKLGGAPDAPGTAVEAGEQPADVAQAAATAQGPPLPGLGRLHRGYPRAHRAAVLLVAMCCYEAAILGQNYAPSAVDPAVVMLVSMFAVVGVAVLSRLWLHVPLRWALVAPVAAVMIGGACMVLVPDILSGVGEAGSLTTGSAWLGFAASVGALVGNVLFIVLAQAYRGSTLSAIAIQYTIVFFNLLVILPISLGVEGTSWSAQFRGMTTQDWLALVYCACVAHAWVAVLIAESTTRLGGVTVSMFFSLRLIGSIAAGKLVLGVTVVKTGVQIAGVVLVVAALTAYTAVQWRAEARRARQPRSDG